MTLTLLVPSSVVRETEDKRTATLKIGYIARAAAVFQADSLVVFNDKAGETSFAGEFVETVLSYAATPPTLRKSLWGRRDELEYAGVLPPLRIPSMTGSESDDSESLTQGIVTEVGSEGRVRVNCELQHPISLVQPSTMTLTEGERVAIRISSREPLRARLIDEPLPGFQVSRMDLSDALNRDEAGVRIATSRHGTAITPSLMSTLSARLTNKGATVVFGSPGRGLPAILGVDVPSDPEATVEPSNGVGFDLWLNTIPQQGSEVVRTEEAMFASLALLTITE